MTDELEGQNRDERSLIPQTKRTPGRWVCTGARKNREVEVLTERQKAAARMQIMGMTNIQIRRAIGIAANTLVNWQNSPLYREFVKVHSDRITEEVVDSEVETTLTAAKRELKLGTLTATRNLLETNKNTVDEKLKARTSVDILELAGLKVGPKGSDKPEIIINIDASMGVLDAEKSLKEGKVILGSIPEGRA